MSSKIQSYDENFLCVPQTDLSRKHQVKKQIFGEIKNVIHNHGVATPLKSNKLGHSVSSKHVSRVSLINKQPILGNEYYKSMSSGKTKTITFSGYNKEYDDIYIDHFDFRKQCCSNIQKSDQEIWSEMNLYDDSFLNIVLDVDQLSQVEEPILEVPDIKDDEESADFFNDINEGYWPAKNNLEDESDIHLLLEKPHYIDFIF